MNQTYFDDAITDEVFAGFAPYNTRRERELGNEDDGDFKESTLMAMSKTDEGYRAVMVGADRRAHPQNPKSVCIQPVEVDTHAFLFD